MTSGKDELSALMDADAGKVLSDAGSLAEIKKLAGEAIELQSEIRHLSEVLAEKNRSLNALLNEKLPTSMSAAGVPSIDVEARGNYPAFTVKTKPFYSASIPSPNSKAKDWTPERREEGFEYLRSLKAASLIKTVINISFDREDKKFADKLIKDLEKRKKKIEFEVSETVHKATLTKWLKEQVENVKKVPDLKKIGGVIGRVAEIKLK